MIVIVQGWTGASADGALLMVLSSAVALILVAALGWNFWREARFSSTVSPTDGARQNPAPEPAPAAAAAPSIARDPSPPSPGRSEPAQAAAPPAGAAPAREEPAVESVGAPGARRLVLFIHGLLGGEQSSWGAFPQLLLEDAVIRGQYDVATFGYRSDFISLRVSPKLEDVAHFLKSELDTRHRDYAEIVIFAHSMGGLVARRYLADALRAAQAPGGPPCRVSRVLFFATPGKGSQLPSLAMAAGDLAAAGLSQLFGGAAQQVWEWAKANGAGEQIKALSAGSDFLFQLERDEEATRLRDRLRLAYLVAEEDQAVDRVSAVGGGDYHIVPETDHWTLVKPDKADHPSVRLAAQFLADTVDQPPYAPDEETRQPVLDLFRSPHAAGADEAKRFVFKNQAIPFVGREQDRAALEAFLAPHESPLRWMVLAGPGGMGKSRLALEVCQAVASGGQFWNAGFATPALDGIDWRRWTPRLPTLITIDYAGADTTAVAELLDGLARQGAGLRHPVRVLLLEREPEGPWLDTILRSDVVNDANTTRAPTRVLQALDDPWAIFTAVQGGDRLGRDASLTVLKEIDDRQRPLFAYLIADAIARGEGVRDWDREALLRNVIKRDAATFWKGPPAGGAAGEAAPITAAERRALVLATMTEGLDAAVFDGSHGQLLPAWDIDRHPALYSAITGRPRAPRIPQLEPDIVGESLVAEDLKAEPDLAIQLIRLAWELKPERAWWFASRLAQDFPTALAETGLMARPANPAAHPFWAMASVNLINVLGGAGAVSEARALYSALAALASETGSAEIQLEQAKGAFNLISDLGRAGAVSEARELYGALAALASETGSVEIQLEKAKGAVNLISPLGGAGAMSEARALYGALAALASETGSVEIQ
ncbi:MAG: hypothetical protein AAF909_06580, partial [Pseudomonadota bacterium]